MLAAIATAAAVGKVIFISFSYSKCKNTFEALLKLERDVLHFLKSPTAESTKMLNIDLLLLVFIIIIIIMIAPIDD